MSEIIVLSAIRTCRRRVSNSSKLPTGKSVRNFLNGIQNRLVPHMSTSVWSLFCDRFCLKKNCSDEEDTGKILGVFSSEIPLWLFLYGHIDQLSWGWG